MVLSIKPSLWEYFNTSRKRGLVYCKDLLGLKMWPTNKFKTNQHGRHPSPSSSSSSHWSYQSLDIPALGKVRLSFLFLSSAVFSVSKSSSERDSCSSQFRAAWYWNLKGEISSVILRLWPFIHTFYCLKILDMHLLREYSCLNFLLAKYSKRSIWCQCKEFSLA